MVIRFKDSNSINQSIFDKILIPVTFAKYKSNNIKIFSRFILMNANLEIKKKASTARNADIV